MLRKIIAAALFVLASSAPSFAASRVWISECGTLGATNSGGVPAQVCAIPFLADSGPLDVSSTSQSVTVSNSTRLVRICAEVQIAIKGASGVTTSNGVLFAGTCDNFGVQPSSVVSVIANP